MAGIIAVCARIAGLANSSPHFHQDFRTRPQALIALLLCGNLSAHEGSGLIRAAKPLVIAVFSLLWLLVSIMRVPDSIGNNTEIGIDTSWVLALPEMLHQQSVSGRDFPFTYGPLSQVLAYPGASLHSSWSAIDSTR